MANALVSIQIIPKLIEGGDTYPLVDEAIKIIAASGLKYEVHPLETTLEGDLTAIMQVIETMNKRMIELGSDTVISQVKIVYKPAGITMNELTEKYS